MCFGDVIRFDAGRMSDLAHYQTPSLTRAIDIMTCFRHNYSVNSHSLLTRFRLHANSAMAMKYQDELDGLANVDCEIA
jgi:hypothetical protein